MFTYLYNAKLKFLWNFYIFQPVIWYLVPNCILFINKIFLISKKDLIATPDKSVLYLCLGQPSALAFSSSLDGTNKANSTLHLCCAFELASGHYSSIHKLPIYPLGFIKDELWENWGVVSQGLKRQKNSFVSIFGSTKIWESSGFPLNPIPDSYPPKKNLFSAPVGKVLERSQHVGI